jgi:hypothetical protein
MQVAADLGDDLHDLDHPQVQVDAAAAKPSHLADPKSAVGAQQHQRPIAGPDAVRQPSNLSRGQKAHLPTLNPRQRHPTTGVLRDHAGVHGGAQCLAEQLVSAAHGRRSQSLPGRVGHPNAHLVLGDRSQWHRPETGEDVEPEQPLVAGLSVGTKLHRCPTPQGIPVRQLNPAQGRVGPGTPQLVVLNPGEEALSVLLAREAPGPKDRCTAPSTSPCHSAAAD